MFIDPHVHCRDEEQSAKETIAHALHVAERAGFTAIFDMPNTARPVSTPERVKERLAISDRVNSPVWYGLYMALTADPEQVKRAVETQRKIDQVVGFKLYAGHSVGNIGVINEADQVRVYETLAREGYKGVVVVHCEKESAMKKDFDPTYPITHAYSRPGHAEVQSLGDQLRFAKAANYAGTLHVAHISMPQSVEVVCSEKELDVTCGATIHHLLLDWDRLLDRQGTILKMNPPLRTPKDREALFDQLKSAQIDWIETDHAPHRLEEKLNPPYMSGITGLQKYPKFIQYLSRNGFSERLIEDITFNNINRTFGLELEPRECLPELHLESEYEFDPYQGTGVLE
ncbi:MAG TPA: dihydroorotase [Candidatus Binatia bacterium]|nr:dihydroorotase [Candidatus Binatia bacterium]